MIPNFSGLRPRLETGPCSPVIFGGLWWPAIIAASGEHPDRKEGLGPTTGREREEEEAAEGTSCQVVSWDLHLNFCSFDPEFPTLAPGILAEGAIALSVTLSGGVLFAS